MAGGKTANITAKKTKSSNVVVPENKRQPNRIVATAEENEAIHAILFTRVCILGSSHHHLGEIASKTIRNIMELRGIPR